jgi:hypothetical protein
VTNFPILLFISFYERQAKLIGAITFYETVAHIAEKVFSRSLKRMSVCNFDVLCFVISPSYLAFFEGLAGVDADIDAVSHKINTSIISNSWFSRYSRSGMNATVI